MKNGQLFVYMHRDGVNVWLPLLDTRSSIVKSFDTPTDPWRVYHKFDTVSSTSIQIGGEQHQAPVEYGVDEIGPYVEVSFNEPTSGMLVVSGFTDSAWGVEVTPVEHDRGEMGVTDLQGLVDGGHLAIGDTIPIIDSGTLTYGPDKQVDLGPGHRVSITVDGGKGNYGIRVIDMAAPSPIIAAMYEWAPYVFPADYDGVSGYPDENQIVEYPAVAANGAFNKLYMTDVRQGLNGVEGNLEYPLFKELSWSGEAWVTKNIFFSDTGLPANKFDNLNIKASPDGKWVALVGGDELYRAAALIYRVDGETPILHQTLLLDGDLGTGPNVYPYFYASEHFDLSNNALVMSHTYTAIDMGDPVTRVGVYRLSEDSWTHLQTIEAPLDKSVSNGYGRTSARVILTPDGQSLFRHSTTSDTGRREDAGFGHIAHYTFNGTEYTHTANVTPHAVADWLTTNFAGDWFEFGWDMSVSADGTRLAAMDNRGTVFILDFDGEAWILKSMINRDHWDVQPPAEYRSPAPPPQAYRVNDYQYYGYYEVKISLSKDGRGLIASGTYDWECGVALLFDIDEDGKISFNRPSFDVAALSEFERENFPYDWGATVGMGATPEHFFSHTVDYTGETTGRTYISHNE